MLVLKIQKQYFFPIFFLHKSTVESRYVKLGLLEISSKSKYFWSPVLNLVLFNLICASGLIFVFFEFIVLV